MILSHSRPFLLLALPLLVLSSTKDAASDTYIFREGLPSGGTSDTYLQEGLENANNGDTTLIEWDGLDNGGENYVLLRFDEPFSVILPTDVITSATLTYYVPSSNAGDPATVNEVTVDWNPASPSALDAAQFPIHNHRVDQ